MFTSDRPSIRRSGLRRAVRGARDGLRATAGANGTDERGIHPLPAHPQPADPPRERRGFVDPGAMLGRAHELDSGLTVRLRLARPSDAHQVRDFLERQSAETLSRRFLTAMPRVSESAVRHFTHYDPRESLIVAATALIGGRERVVGLADVALLGTGLAEIGMIVDDEHHREGIGRALSEAIAWLAVQRGATHLKAEMLERNVAMLRLMQRLGPTVEAVEDGMATAYAELPALRTAAAA